VIRSFTQRTVSLFLYMLLFIACAVLPIACNAQQPSSTDAKTITVGVSPWPGYAAHYVATANNLFDAEGIAVEEVFFPNQGDSDSAFLAGKVDLSWQGFPNSVLQMSRDPSIKVVFQGDYSNGADGIIGRNINGPADLKGKQVARENIFFEELLLRKYLEQLGLTRDDVTVVDLSAADSAAAFIAGRVDLAVTFEPWMTKAAKEGKGEVVFSTKDSNVIPDGILARTDFIQNNKPELLAYLRAIDKAVQLIKTNPADVTDVIAKSLSITPQEVPEQMGGVKLYDLQMNKTISFTQQEPMSLFNSLEFASNAAKAMNLIPKPIDVGAALDPSLVNAL
jgi:NitT/TauT family transport system substrate-binding protein